MCKIGIQIFTVSKEPETPRFVAGVPVLKQHVGQMTSPFPSSLFLARPPTTTPITISHLHEISNLTYKPTIRVKPPIKSSNTINQGQQHTTVYLKGSHNVQSQLHFHHFLLLLYYHQWPNALLLRSHIFQPFRHDGVPNNPRARRGAHERAH